MRCAQHWNSHAATKTDRLPPPEYIPLIQYLTISTCQKHAPPKMFWTSCCPEFLPMLHCQHTSAQITPQEFTQLNLTPESGAHTFDHVSWWVRWQQYFCYRYTSECDYFVALLNDVGAYHSSLSPYWNFPFMQSKWVILWLRKKCWSACYLRWRVPLTLPTIVGCLANRLLVPLGWFIPSINSIVNYWYVTTLPQHETHNIAPS